MSAVGTWAAILFLAFGPGGWQIEARHQRADALERRLVPLGWLGETPRGLWLAVHPDPGRSALWVEPGTSAAFVLDVPLPGAPYVVLDAGAHLRPAVSPADSRAEARTWLATERLPVDSAEHYYRALLDAHAALTLSRDSSWRGSLAVRADAAMSGVPAEHRADAFREATLEFAAHVLSVAHEIGRHVRRREPGALCGVLGHPATLFGAWERAHGDASFVGGWWQSGDPDSGRPGVWRLPPTGLRPEDKRWVVREILGASWTGDPKKDFAFLCEGASDSDSDR